MRSLKSFFALLIVAACVTTGGCRPHVEEQSWEEHDYVEYLEYNSTNFSDEDKKDALNALHAWLAAQGYKRLTNPTDIAAATDWSGAGSSFEEVWRKQLDPAVPKSEFVVTFSETKAPAPKELIISLASDRWGNDTDHARQIPMVKKEWTSFDDAFATYHWLKRTETK